MIISVTLLILNLSVPGLLLDQYNKIAHKNVTALLGSGELEQIEVTSGREYYLFESIADASGAIVVLSSAKGRYEHFDYMVILKPNLEIIDIKILKYRSEYGYEISNKGWLKNFYGKPGSRFEYGKDIDVVSGASFSANSLVNDINQIMDHLKSASTSH